MRVTRRRIVLGSAAAAVAALQQGLLASPERRGAFDARSLREALEAADLVQARPSDEIRLVVPQLVDNPAMVPIQMESALPGTRTLALFIDRNPFPYIARFDFDDGALPFVGLRVRVAESSVVRAIGVTPAGVFTAIAPTQAAAGGCGAEDAQAPLYRVPPPPIKLRARADGPGADVRVLMTHPMENGLRRTADGALIPERFIRTFVVRRNGQPVVRAALGRSMSQDPLLSLRLAPAAVGDQLEVSWRDSAGAVRIDATTVT